MDTQKIIQKMWDNPSGIRFGELKLFGIFWEAKLAQATASTKCPGRAIHALISKIPTGWQSPIKSSKCWMRSLNWRVHIMDAKKYAYRVIWSDEDQEFVGRCAEFPSLSWLDPDQGKAFSGIVNLVENVLADMEANGEKIPEPISSRKFSGKFVLRITPRRHRELAERAAEARVSLNRYVNDLLDA